MDIKLRSFRGVDRFDATFDGIALVTGPNGAGKSSVCTAVAAALSGQTQPFGLAKSRLGALVRSGSDTARVELSDDSGSVTVEWPDGKRMTKGEPMEASRIAVGFASFIGLDEKERATLLGALLKAQPKKDDLVAVLRDAAVSEETIDRVWSAIEKHGWDGAHKHAVEKGQRLKGQWEQITKERFGSAKGLNWVPAGWSPDLDAASEESLTAAITAAETARDEAVGRQAVSAEKWEEQKKAYEDGKIAEQRELAIRAEQNEIGPKLKAAETALAALPVVPKADPEASCPECGAIVSVRSAGLNKFELKKLEKIESTEVERRTKARTEAQNLVAELQGKKNELANELQAVIARCRHLATIYKGFSPAKPPTGASSEEVEAAKNAVRTATATLAAWKSKREADETFAAQTQNQAIIAALDETGVRKTAMLRSLDKFNTDLLAPICRDAGWGLVTVEPDLSVRLGGRPYLLLSEGEAYRARVTLQVALATLDLSDGIVIDGADILDAKGRNGLMKMLGKLEVPVVLGMTISKRDQVPDLVRAKLGASYWIEGAVGQPAVVAQAAE